MTIYFDMDGTFSSPLGDGLVSTVVSPSSPKKKFSSPSGDGLVLKEYTLNENLYNIFVPEWGWVGSCSFYPQWRKYLIFVPAWGWVGSRNFDN